MHPIVKFKKKHPKVVLPSYETAGAAGADVRYFPEAGEAFFLHPGERYTFGTGLLCEIPNGYEIQVRPRSGLAHKNGLTVLNAPGTIDSDYRGEIGVILLNTGDEAVPISSGDRIAQIVVAPVIQAKFEVVSELSDTRRGAGAFGSTGVA